MKYIPRVSDQRLLAGLGLMVGFAAFDLIPNGDFTRMAFFLSGALWGCLNGILQEATVMRNKRRLARIATLKEARSAAPAPLAGMAALSALLLAVPVAAAAPDATGGGFTGAGIEGAYFANPDLDGTPSFIRRDVRIDFDWKDVRPIGGSTAEPYPVRFRETILRPLERPDHSEIQRSLHLPWASRRRCSDQSPSPRAVDLENRGRSVESSGRFQIPAVRDESERAVRRPSRIS